MANTINTLGDSLTLYDYLTNQLTSFEDDTIETIRYMAFGNRGNLEIVSLPKVKNITSFAFWWCTGLKSAYFSSATIIGGSAFYGCSKLSTVIIPNASYIDDFAFFKCLSLQEIYFPKVTSIFGSAFYSCSSLNDINLPIVEYVGNSAFAGCTSLSKINLPMGRRIGNDAFARCSNLETVSLPNVTYLSSNVFYDCKNLESVYFLGSSVPTAAAGLINWQGIFDNTPFQDSSYLGGRYGSVFVRASMLESFKSGTNWATISDRMVGLTDEEIAALDNE